MKAPKAFLRKRIKKLEQERAWLIDDRYRLVDEAQSYANTLRRFRSWDETTQLERAERLSAALLGGHGVFVPAEAIVATLDLIGLRLGPDAISETVEASESSP